MEPTHRAPTQDSDNSHSHTLTLVLNALGLIAATIAGLLDEDFTTGVVIAGFVTVMSLCVELRAAILTSSRALVHAIVQLDPSIQLSQHLARDDFLANSVNELVDRYRSVLPDPHLQQAARAALKECSSKLYQLEGGTLSIDIEQGTSYLAERLRDPDVETVLAVSKGPIWSDEEGKAYNQVNIRRAREGVNITRIFIEDDPRSISPDTFQAMCEQYAAKINVSVANGRGLPDDLKTGLAIFNGEVVASLDVVDRRTGTFEVSRGKEHHRVRGALKDYDRLRKYSAPFDPFDDAYAQRPAQ
jgi:hypothetical protein